MLAVHTVDMLNFGCHNTVDRLTSSTPQEMLNALKYTVFKQNFIYSMSHKSENDCHTNVVHFSQIPRRGILDLGSHSQMPVMNK